MRPPSARTRRTRGKWARYNAWRAAHRELDRQRRLARHMERVAEGEARLLAHAEAIAALPPPPPSARKPLRLRITIEVVGHGKHRITAEWCPVFRRWSVPQRRVLKGVAALMQRAPEIAGESRARLSGERICLT